MKKRLSLVELKRRLEQLIDGSEALKAVSEEERKRRTALMMKGSYEDIQRYIGVFEKEKKTLKDIAVELGKHREEIEDAVATAKYDKIKAERQVKLARENKLKVYDEREADELIGKLDKIQKSSVKKVGKDSKSDKTLSPRSLNKFFVGALDVFFGGVVGIFITYLVILFMPVYEKFDVAFGANYAFLIPVYLVAVVFGSVLGFSTILFLRFFRIKNYLLSVVSGGLVGGVCVGLIHVVSGLDFDIVLMLDLVPIEFRAYWVALVFSFVIGFFAQSVNRAVKR